ncbi:hypothetical protein ACWX0K_07215 [Nitrobacteraceae bacterium UC4446_H13]
MDAINDKAFAALGAYPIIQSAVAITILLGALYLVIRATRDKPAAPPPLPPREPIPQWLMMGPLHDMIGAVHDVAEQSRRTNDLLERADQSLMACKVTLELIRDESRLR